jgi:signal peptidase I
MVFWVERGIKMEEVERRSEVGEWIRSIVIAIAIAVLVKTFVFNTTYVLGNSMYPTLHEKDRLFAMKVSLYFHGPARGDIVVLEAPDSPGKDYIKRVIGISGDVVLIENGEVYVNGELLEESYLTGEHYTHIYDDSIWVVPEGEVFVLGDNRAEGASKDSRYFGTIPVSKLKGITGFRYYPIDDRFGKLE